MKVEFGESIMEYPSQTFGELRDSSGLVGDRARLRERFDEDGYLYIMARTDDVINVAGHRLSTGGMEEVLASHPDVAECAVIGVSDELKGQLPLGFLCLNAGLPKTRSGKILRGTMVSIADGKDFKMPATIDDPAILDEIREALEGLGYAGH